MITLNVPRQEAFDKVYNHLWNQGGKAVNPDGYCVYRGVGTMCAIGRLIPDYEYTEELEGSSLSTLIACRVIETNDYNFFAHLQAIHDNFTGGRHQWKSYINDEFRFLAERWNVDFTPRCITQQ
jgi:hypothetical protein